MKAYFLKSGLTVYMGQCICCHSYCWLVTSEKRFDGAEVIAGCPYGKRWDRMCDAIAEAEFRVSQRRNRPDKGGGYTDMGEWT